MAQESTGAGDRPAPNPRGRPRKCVPRAIDLELLTELWNQRPVLTLKVIAERLSTPERRLSAQQISGHAHRAGLEKRKEYNTRQPGAPRQGAKTVSPRAMKLLRVRCPQCSAQVPFFDVDNHTCPDSRIVARAKFTYSGPPVPPSVEAAA